MAELSLDDLRQQLDALVARANKTGERLLITQDGKPIAALTADYDLRWLEQLEDADDLAFIKEDAAHPQSPSIPLQEVIADRDARCRRTE
jgi:prevent-host-death family protein